MTPGLGEGDLEITKTSVILDMSLNKYTDIFYEIINGKWSVLPNKT